MDHRFQFTLSIAYFHLSTSSHQDGSVARENMPVTISDAAASLPDQETTAFSSSSYQYQCSNNSSSSRCEIEEENSNEFFEINHMEPIREECEGSLFSVDVNNRDDEDCVYVGVGKSESSMDALSWTLKNAVNNETTMVYLIHVFPEIHHIPSPLGKLPRSQVSPQQLQSYMVQERGKRRELLQKFLNLCSASKVKVDTILIESDKVAKAILDLIPILNMRKLVLGTTKSNLRKLRAKKGNGVVDQVLQNAPEFFEIKIICDGKEVDDEIMSGLASPLANHNSPKHMPQLKQQQPTSNDSFACMCFKSPRVM
ncbi:hypothetical protein K2173_013255 [Erythroxylum novogranatense]|uniref:Uncharacterized protein n=1 Tax=Erythroxylum novogranatense TaxID=1862640 RepID=A0AAV8TTM0_9ROSI|nr:hypothetical protein K2173_013255 [Erythroxylum novogranatense]